MKRIALLSNVNINPIARVLKSENQNVWVPAAYGDVFGSLLNADSELWKYNPERIYLLIDISELLVNCRTSADVISTIEKWYSQLLLCDVSGTEIYVSTCVCRRDPYYSDWKENASTFAEEQWESRLNEYVSKHDNAYRFELADIIYAEGINNFFDDKLWYLGRVPYTASAAKAIASHIESKEAGGKKVLLFDLDNTIWGGVVGDLGAEGIELSDEHGGLIYKDIQREIRHIKDAGIVLCVVSKNNYEDGLEPFRVNSQMVLKEDDITSFKVNWNQKDQNIREIAKELNLGLDSMVFLDDNPTERQLVKTMVPEVEVIEFPDDVSQLPSLLQKEFITYFQRTRLTEEDRAKTVQYNAMAKRAALEKSSSSFDDFLKDLDIRAQRVDPKEREARIAQLIGKTNQFNLTTRRYSSTEVEKIIDDTDRHIVYAFDIIDCFTNNGLTALAIVDLCGDFPRIDTMILSCRVMGKRIEDFVIDRIESDLVDQGYERLESDYIPTKKNKVVSDLFDRLGYQRVEESEDGSVHYAIDLLNRPKRKFYVREI